MSASEQTFAAALLLLLTSAPALAQETEVDRLRAENSVLRLELRALRKRLETLEERFEKFLATRAAREQTWPEALEGEPGKRELPEGLAGALAADGADLLLTNLRLPDDAGGVTPQQLVEAWALALSDLSKKDAKERRKGLRDLATRFGAYAAKAPHPFLVPRRLWSKVRGEASASPAFGELLLACETLAAGELSGRVVDVSVSRSEAPGPERRRRSSDPLAAWLGVRSLGSSSGPDLAGATVDGLVAGSPASRIEHTQPGLRVGDCIESVSFDDQVLLTPTVEELRQAIAAAGPGREITLGLKRPEERSNRPVLVPYAVSLTLAGKGAAAEEAAEAPRPAVTCRIRCRLDGSTVLVDAVKLNGRWLIVSVQITSLGNQVAEGFRLLTQAFPHDLGMSQEERDELFANLGKGLEQLEERLPLYEFRLYRKDEEDFGLEARPRIEGYPTVRYGYVGDYSPSKYPYRVRVSD